MHFLRRERGKKMRKRHNINRYVVCGLLAASLAVTSLSGCSKEEEYKIPDVGYESDGSLNAYGLMEQVNGPLENVILDDKYENYYEIFPYSYCDSDGDGIGDINGIISKLDYIQSLNVTALWLTPVHQSTTYHKYDVVDYYSIDEDFGTLEDYENLLAECEERDIDVIMDLVVNHTSTKNDWFVQATDYLRSLEDGEEPDASECKYVDYYNFSTKAQSGYSKVSGCDYYYEARFWSEMPDLNLDSEDVRAEIADIMEFWINEGVAGFRLDATTSYYTGQNNLCIDFLSFLEETLEALDPDAYMVGECWESYSIYTQYYSSGVDSFFDFDFSGQEGKIKSTLLNGSALNYGLFIEKVDEAMYANNEDGIAAVFTANHDQARTAGYFVGENYLNKVKMCQGLAAITGGNYFLYYGDEIGMRGSGDDQNKRLPMNWVSDEFGDGMCDSVGTSVIEQSNGTVESQQADGDSILYYVAEANKLRLAYPEIARGTNTTIEELSDSDVLVLQKEYDGSTIYVIVNISEEEKTVDLSSLTVSGENAEIGGILVTTAEEPTIEEDMLTLPMFSIVIVK